MTSCAIRPLVEADRQIWLGLRQALWMGSDATTLAAEAGTLLSEPQRYGALQYGVLLAHQNGETIGFIEVSLRDNVDGFDGRAVGYVEGVYVGPRHQGRGIGRALLDAAADWARAKGATQLASDVQPDNAASLTFHERSGFRRLGHSGSGDRRQVLLARPLA